MAFFDPRNMTFEAWSSMTAPQLQQYGAVPWKVAEKDWRQWADSIAMLPELGPYLIPNSRGFSDWRAWAAKLNETLGLLFGP